MQIYNYNATSGEYIGQSTARPDPMETGSYLIPAHASEVAPPEPGEGQAVVWMGEGWDLVEDHRGVVLYSTATGATVEITELGPIPDGLTDTAPGEFEVWDGDEWVVDTEALAASIRAQRDTLLAASDWTQTLDAPLTATAKQAWKVYREALRDITKQAGFPESVDWPVAPEISTTVDLISAGNMAIAESVENGEIIANIKETAEQMEDGPAKESLLSLITILGG